MFMRIPFLPASPPRIRSPTPRNRRPAGGRVHPSRGFCRARGARRNLAACSVEDTVFGFAAREVGHGSEGPVGFVLARLAAGEGRNPHRCRCALAPQAWPRMAVDGRGAARTACAHGPTRCSLRSMKRTPQPSRSIAALASSQVGRRPNYYSSKIDGSSAGALVMRRDLR